MDGGRLVPLIQSAKDIIGYLLKPFPIQIICLRKIILIAVLATKIAEIRDVPLNMEGIFHQELQISNCKFEIEKKSTPRTQR
jgi:hypothetical protein